MVLTEQHKDDLFDKLSEVFQIVHDERRKLDDELEKVRAKALEEKKFDEGSEEAYEDYGEGSEEGSEDCEERSEESESASDLGSSSEETEVIDCDVLRSIVFDLRRDTLYYKVSSLATVVSEQDAVTPDAASGDAGLAAPTSLAFSTAGCKEQPTAIDLGDTWCDQPTLLNVVEEVKTRYTKLLSIFTVTDNETAARLLIDVVVQAALAGSPSSFSVEDHLNFSYKDSTVCRGNVDYVFKHGGSAIGVLEAKKTSTFGDSARGQLFLELVSLIYSENDSTNDSFNVQLKWGILSDARLYEFCYVDHFGAYWKFASFGISSEEEVYACLPRLLKVLMTLVHDPDVLRTRINQMLAEQLQLLLARAGLTPSCTCQTQCIWQP